MQASTENFEANKTQNIPLMVKNTTVIRIGDFMSSQRTFACQCPMTLVHWNSKGIFNQDEGSDYFREELEGISAGNDYCHGKIMERSHL